MKELKFSILTIFLVGAIIVSLIASLFSMTGSAQVSQPSTNIVQVTIKSKNWGPDPAWGGSRATITVTTNKLGNMVYVEEYYGVSSGGEPKYYSGNRYENNLKDYTVTFDLIRPDHDHRQAWSQIKAKVLIDKEIIYENWINTSGTYKSFTGRSAWYNDSAMEIGKGRPVVQKREPFDPMSSATATPTEVGNDAENNGNDKNVNSNVDNGTDIIVPEKSPMLGIIVVISILLSVYILRRARQK